MAYRIEYGPPIPEQYRRRHSSHRLQIMTAAFLLLFALAVKVWFPAGAQQLQEILLTGTPSVTQQALDTLVTDVHHGESFRDAFAVFCEQIIAHDQTLSG